MNNQTAVEQGIGPRTPSRITTIDPDKPQPIRYWQQKWENYLGLIGRKATQERYARALEGFLSRHRCKTYAHEFLRPEISQYVQDRLEEGASISTVRLELSAIRGLFQFMLDMGAADVMFNPAKNVKISQFRKQVPDVTPERQNGARESQSPLPPARR